MLLLVGLGYASRVLAKDGDISGCFCLHLVGSVGLFLIDPIFQDLSALGDSVCLLLFRKYLSKRALNRRFDLIDLIGLDFFMDSSD